MRRSKSFLRSTKEETGRRGKKRSEREREKKKKLRTFRDYTITLMVQGRPFG